MEKKKRTFLLPQISIHLPFSSRWLTRTDEKMTQILRWDHCFF